MNRLPLAGCLFLLMACSRGPQPVQQPVWAVRILEISDEEREPLAAALNALIRSKVPPDVPICIMVENATLPPPGIAMLDSTTAGLIRHSQPPYGYRDCPATYGGMELVVIADGRPPREPPRAPPGYQNPFQFKVRERLHFLPDSARYRIEVFRTHTTDFYSCATRPSDGEWIAECRLFDSAIH